MKTLLSICALVVISTSFIEECAAVSPWAQFGVTCERETVDIPIRNEIGCSNPSVAVRYCRGTCRSASLFHYFYPYYRGACRCCRAVQTASRPVLLTCPDGSHKVKFINEAKACACRDCGF